MINNQQNLWSRKSDSNRRVLSEPRYECGGVNHCPIPAIYVLLFNDKQLSGKGKN